jgi:outer membrane protein insertion porin family
MPTWRRCVPTTCQRGYLEFRVDSTQVAISPDKQDITITVNVTEGERFVVSGVKLEGNYLDREDEFKSLVAIRPGEPTTLTRWPKPPRPSPNTSAIRFCLCACRGGAEVDRENNRVSLVLQAEPSRRAYVRRINVSGNNRTRDEVDAPRIPPV